MTDKKKRKTKEKGYLSNKEMFAELLICQKLNRVSDKLGRMYVILATRYASKPNFSGYSYKSEMIGTGILACVNALNKFDPTKSENPFAYYTSVIHNSFIQILNKEKRQQQIRDQLLVDANYNPSLAYQDRNINYDDDFD